MFSDDVKSVWLGVVAGVIVAVILAVAGYFYATIRVLPRRNHKVLVYVSAGSTCRDPMAKAITDQLLEERKLKTPVDVYSVGLVPSDKEASWGARQAIKGMYGEDLLQNHKPKGLTRKLVNRADLILVMDQRLFDSTEYTLPRSKTHMFKPFFGLSGDIEDPYRMSGERDPETLARYEKCANELRKILSEHMDVLLRALEAA
jgi:protein-tyrosine-phosphatase